MKRSTKINLRLVIGFGFLNGLFIAIGINPQAEILSFLDPYFAALGGYVYLIFGLIPTLIALYVLYFIYKHSGFKGFLAVFCGYIAGLFILSNPVFALAFGLLGWFVGEKAIR